MALTKSLYQTPEEIESAQASFNILNFMCQKFPDNVWYNGRIDTLENPDHVQRFHSYIRERVAVHEHASMTDRNGCPALAVRMNADATAILVRLGTEVKPAFILYKDEGYEAIANSEFSQRVTQLKKAGLL